MSAETKLPLGLGPAWRWLILTGGLGVVSIVGLRMPDVAWITAVGVLALGTAPLVLWAVAWARSSVRLLADGLVVRGGISTIEVPYLDVAAVVGKEDSPKATPHDAYILRKSGGKVVLYGDRGQVERAVHAIEQKIVALGEPPELPPQLERDGRSAAAWISELARAGALDDSSFRSATFDRREVLAVLEDPAAVLPTRAAAAALLLAGLTDEERSRVRVAAAATAVPKLRVALEAVADENTHHDAVAERLLAAADAPE